MLEDVGWDLTKSRSGCLNANSPVNSRAGIAIVPRAVGDLDFHWGFPVQFWGDPIPSVFVILVPMFTSTFV